MLGASNTFLGEDEMARLALTPDDRERLEQHFETAIAALTSAQLILISADVPKSAVKRRSVIARTASRIDTILGKLSQIQDLCK